MTRSDIIKFIILRSIGNFLVLFAIFGVFATFGPAFYYEVQYRVIQVRGVHYTVETAQTAPQGTSPLGQIMHQPTPTPAANSGLASVVAGPQDQILTPKDTDFSILIPKLGVSEKVYPNVDPVNETEFLPILQKGIAHAKGTVFPGMKGNVYLFAHSTDNFWDVGRYNAIFYLLKDLSVGDDIILFFENQRHNYVVADSKIVDPSDVSAIVNGQNTGQEQVILQTCWPPGTTWKRLLVFAKPK